jgi:LmbE family N-acetylglucosaminyl deacetylase
MAETVLVIAPHPDDEAIGCGGTICRHRAAADAVRVVFLTSGERGLADLSREAVQAMREAEAAEAARVLGVTCLDFLRLPDLALGHHVASAAARVLEVLQEHKPDLIYLPHPAEFHPDHAACLPIVQAALARLQGRSAPPELHGYEVWSPLPEYDWVQDISSVMRQKLRAVRCYRSQLQQFRYDRAVRGLNQYRGVMGAGSRHGEAFVYLDPSPPGP